MWGNIAGHAAAVTPSDTANLKAESIIYVGGAGNLAIITIEGETVTFLGMTAGTVLPVWTYRVMATNTTATNLVAIW